MPKVDETIAGCAERQRGLHGTKGWLLSDGVEIIRLGDVVSGKKVILSEESLDKVLFLYLLEGAARVTLSDVGVRTLSPEEVLVVFPGRFVSVELTAESNRLMLIAFEGRDAVDAALGIGFWDLMQVTERYEGNLMAEILTCFHAAPTRGRDRHVLGLVEQLLETVWLRARNGSGKCELYNAVREVNRLPVDKLTTLTAADALGISRTKFNELFLTGLGMRPGAYLEQIITARSLAMLFWTNTPVARVAQKMGFSSASSFATFLRRRIGRTPKEFRQSPIPLHPPSESRG